MRYETLDAWLEWLEKRHPREIDLGLDRIREVAARLDLLKPQARLLTVAGTNGKGSCVAASAYLLGRAGCKVGVYTSPHFQHYCERITIDGVPVSEDEVCRAFAGIDVASAGVSLTYFEFGTLAALDIFRSRGVDIMVLEVGLGGRLDAVNILDADVGVVTGIDLDHQDWLGTSRDSIGREKAGIFRAGQPALCADPAPPQGLLESAQQTGAQLRLVDRDFGFVADGHSWRWWGRGIHEELQTFESLPLPALPLPSLAAAVQGVILLGVQVERPWLEDLSQLSLPGRFQRLHHAGREFILDVAHNPAATNYLARGLAALPALGSTHAVVAMMADKDHRGSLAALDRQVDVWWLAELSHVPRAATPEQLMDVLGTHKVKARGCGRVADCIEQCLAQTEDGDRIVILGSFYTVAAALDWLAAQSEEVP
jgi:dihydrofolate synthase / folylpolyglutamate synthase